MSYLSPIMARPALYDRETALANAMTLFWEKGFHATSVKDLEGALKMNPGSIYAAFSSKEKLYQEAIHSYFESGLRAFQLDMEQAQSPLAGLADHIRSYAKMPLDHPQRQVCLLMKTIVETQKTEPALAAKARDHLEVTRDEIASVFQSAIEAGELPSGTDANYLARRYQTNVGALRVELHQNTDPSVIHAIAEDMAQDIERLRVTSS